MRIWKLLSVAIGCLLLVAFIGCGEKEEGSTPEAEPETVAEEKVVADHVPAGEEIGTEITCGICGMTMAVTAEMPAVTYDGQNYYFCNAEEKAKFAAAPDEFVKPAEEGGGEEATDH
jgi:YHS domain-containing protein